MMDLESLIAAAEEFADSPDRTDALIAVVLSYLLAGSDIVAAASGEELSRLGYVVATCWEVARSDGARLLAMPTLDRVLIAASTGRLDLDRRDLDEINAARVRVGEPFWKV